MKAKWTKAARQDRSDIFDYTAGHDRMAGFVIDERILQAIEVIEQYPMAAREGRLTGTRELIVPQTRLIAVYRVDGRLPVIVRIIHTSRDWPPKD